METQKLIQKTHSHKGHLMNNHLQTSSSDPSPQVFQAISAYTQPTEISDDILGITMSDHFMKSKGLDTTLPCHDAEIL